MAAFAGICVAGIAFGLLRDMPGANSGDAAIAKMECLTENVSTNGSRADVEACNDAVERRARTGPYTPWYEQHLVLTALAAGLVVFFVIAAGGRLFLE